MNNYHSTINNIRNIPLTDFLARLGYMPAKISGREIFYKSMLRDEKTPSLCLNEHIGVWYDHGGPNLSGIKGGNIIDLALAYWYPAPFNEVIRNILSIMNLPAPTIQYPKRECTLNKNQHKHPHYKVVKVKELGSNPMITKYLRNRKIWDQARGLLKEVYYTVLNTANKKIYFSVGWRNDLGNWEIRSRIRNYDFKACLGKKAITTINPGNENLSLFEGVMDYLSWRKDYSNDESTIIILNSVNMLDKILDQISDFKRLTAYFDRDKAGMIALDKLTNRYPITVDGSTCYAGFKDYNEMLVANIKFTTKSNIVSDQTKIINMTK